MKFSKVQNLYVHREFLHEFHCQLLYKIYFNNYLGVLVETAPGPHSEISSGISLENPVKAPLKVASTFFLEKYSKDCSRILSENPAEYIPKFTAILPAFLPELLREFLLKFHQKFIEKCHQEFFKDFQFFKEFF